MKSLSSASWMGTSERKVSPRSFSTNALMSEIVWAKAALSTLVELLLSEEPASDVVDGSVVVVVGRGRAVCTFGFGSSWKTHAMVATSSTRTTTPAMAPMSSPRREPGGGGGGTGADAGGIAGQSVGGRVGSRGGGGCPEPSSGHSGGMGASDMDPP